MSQFALPFEWPADPRDDEFLISDSNAKAVHSLEHWGAWPVMAALLTGPRKSGRSGTSKSKRTSGRGSGAGAGFSIHVAAAATIAAAAT